MADKNVLIYEQDDKFVKALKLYFRGSEWEPTSVTTPAQITSAAQKTRPNVLLVAVENDDPASRSMLSGITSQDATRGIPLVIMSTKKNDTDLFSGGIASVGGAAYIKKPFIKKAILQLLDDVQAGGGSPGPAAGKGKGVDLGTVFSAIDEQIDNFFEKDATPSGESEEFSITLEDDGAAPAKGADSEPLAITLDDDGPSLPTVDVVSGASAAPRLDPITSPVAAPFTEPAVDSKAARDEPVAGVDPAEVKRLRDRIRELEGELRQRTDEARAAAREKEKLEHGLGKKESELLERVKGLEKDNEELSEDVKKRKQLVAQMTASVQQLNDDLEEKDRKHGKEIEGWQAQLAKLQGEYDQLQEKSSEQAHGIEDRSDEIQRLTRRVQDLEAERDELTRNLERMTELKNEADRTIQGLEETLASTRATLSDTEQQLATERARIAAARQSFEKGIDEMREGLSREMDAAREQIERGLAQAREAATKSSSDAKSTLEQGIAQLLGS